MSSIPTVDCCDGNVDAAKTAILSAIYEFGCVYLTNFGIPPHVYEDLFEVSWSFFALPRKTKEQFLRKTNAEDWGYIKPGLETLSQVPPESQVELREAFNYNRKLGEKTFPKEIPNFQISFEKFYDEAKALGMKLLQIIGENLNDGEGVIVEGHAELGSSGNSSAARMLHYPPVPADFVEDIARCGEHSDYGSITLLFQDEVGGLEVQNKNGEFVYAAPVPGAVLVNTGDLLERWSDGTIKAVRHRVRTPPRADPLRSKVRYSLVLFIVPDDAAIVRPLNGSTRYPTSTAREYLDEQFSKSYF